MRLRALAATAGHAAARPAWQRMAAAGGAWLVAFVVTMAAAPAVERANFVFFWAAVLFAAWYSGLAPALAAAAASVLAVHYVIFPPPGGGALAWHQYVTFVIFTVVSTTVSALTARLAEAQRRADERAHELLALTEELQAQQAELEQQTEEAQALAGEAEEARREAEAANEAKMQFLRAMSHELRTPLSAIQGYAHILRDGMVGAMTDPQRTQLTRIVGSARHLIDVVDEILTFARLEAGAEALRLQGGVSADVLAEDAASMVEPVVVAKGLAFTLSAASGATLTTDGARVRQVLVNLLSNAAKFTERGSISLSVVARDDEVRFAVRDTGIGIAPGHIDRIWEPFWQVDQQLTRSVGGAGLGLAVSRRLARLLGGDIDVESVPGDGTTFVFCLPRNVQRGVTEDLAAPPAREAARGP